MSSNNRTHHEYLILGAGPAGLQLAHHLGESGRDYLVLEAKSTVGSFFREFPRHRQLLSINKVYTGREDPEFNLRHDWNSLLSDRPDLLMRDHSVEYFPPADALVEYLERYARELELRIRFDTRIARVGREPDGGFVLTDAGGHEWACTKLIVATGVGKPYVPDIPGIELAVGYEQMSLDRSDYRNSAVLILGKGNSALETAEYLIPEAAVIHVLSPQPVKLAWNTRHVGHVRAINNNFFDTYHLKSQNAAIDGNVHEIRKTPAGRYIVKFASIHVADETEQIEYDHVLRCTGFRFDDSLFAEDCKPALRSCGRLPAMTPGFESTNIPNLFFAGATMQSLDYKKGQSAFIHGFRYNVRSLAALLDFRYHDVPLPSDEIPATAAAIADAVLERLSRVSSLWQQVGFLCDVVLLPKPGDEPATLRRIHDLPYDLAVRDARSWAAGGEFLIVGFRFGHCANDPFDHPRTADVFEGNTSTAIHPICEHWRGPDKLGEFHVLEDFAADWTGAEYKQTLATFLEATLRGGQFEPVKREGVRRDLVRGTDMLLV